MQSHNPFCRDIKDIVGPKKKLISHVITSVVLQGFVVLSQRVCCDKMEY